MGTVLFAGTRGGERTTGESSPMGDGREVGISAPL